MTGRTLATLAYKLLGVYILINGVGMIPSFIGTLATRPEPGGGLVPPSLSIQILGVIPPIVFFIAAGLLIWIKADYFASFADDDQDTPVAIGISGHELQTVLFSVIGLSLVVHALPSFVSIALTIIYRMGFNNPSVYPSFAKSLLELLLGLWLIFGSKGIVSFLYSLRNMDRRRSDEEDY